MTLGANKRVAIRVPAMPDGLTGRATSYAVKTLSLKKAIDSWPIAFMSVSSSCGLQMSDPIY